MPFVRNVRASQPSGSADYRDWRVDQVAHGT
jgi:hypothetical protein